MFDTGGTITVFASKLAGCVGMHAYIDKTDLIHEFNALRNNKVHRSFQEECVDKIKNMAHEEQTYITGVIGTRYDDVTTMNEALRSLACKCNDPDILKHIKSELYKQQGIHEEDNIRQHFSNKNNVCVVKNDEFATHHMFTIHDTDIRIGGRHDGLSTDGSLVEIKNRMNRFLGVPLYELVQVHAYMVIFDTTRATHVENYKGETRETDVVFDPVFWNNIKSSLFELFSQILDKPIES
jgi:hypothetical protein